MSDAGSGTDAFWMHDDGASRVDATRHAKTGTIVVVGRHRVAKLSSQPDRVRWESELAARLFNYVLDRRITPCVPRYHGPIRIEPGTPAFESLWDTRRTAAAHQYTARSPLSTMNSASAAVRGRPLEGYEMERVPGRPLDEWARSPHSIEQWACVLFQTLYTVDAFHALGIRHNDTHGINVYVDDGGWPAGNVCFGLESGERFVIRSGMPAVHLIDFDLASTTGVTRSAAWSREWTAAMGSLQTYHNTSLESNLCDGPGMCNARSNPKFDAHTLLCNVARGSQRYGYQVPAAVQEWIRGDAVPDGALLDAAFSRQGGFHCRLGRPFTGADGQQGFVPSDAQQRPTRDILASAFFDRLRWKPGDACDREYRVPRG